MTRQPPDKPILYLMLGYPGAGKTTASKALAAVTGAVHLSSDYVRQRMFPQPRFDQYEHDALYRTVDYIAELLLRSGVSVIYDANLNRHSHRTEKYALADSLGIERRLLWVRVSNGLAKDRALHVKDTSLRPFGPMPDEMFDRIAHVFEEPGADEEWTGLDGTKITEEYVKQTLKL